eukprot:TRINITY_DN1016_c0_g2_i2.p1 TRINITY_DN1016_c0_g2~~TRINITY_DN1016_c0_g2_i2.p1  ORF type:complete len:143 (-),score=5.81 TRINITY_DN1016_c0_g2_i2:443-871(-)
MTSPPFFDFEIYTTSIQGQSVAAHPTLARWTVRFLLVAIRHACSVLRDRGHCIIHITDVFKTRVCEAMLLLSLWLIPRAKYLGVICSTRKAGRLRWMWVLQMGSSEDEKQQQKAKADLRQFFRDEYDEAEALVRDEAGEGAV